MPNFLKKGKIFLGENMHAPPRLGEPRRRNPFLGKIVVFRARVWYNMLATQFYIFFAIGYTGIWCILISDCEEKLCGNNLGILSAGVP